MGMNRALIGKQYVIAEARTITAAEALAYADACNADIAAYRGGDDAAVVHPMFAFSYPALSAPLFDPELGADMMRLVHGDQDMRFVAPVKAGDALSWSVKIEDIVEKTSGEVLTAAIVTKNQRGEIVQTSSSGLFIRGARKRENLEAEKKERAAEEEAWTQAAPAWTSTENVALDQSKRYGPASGDMNPIHLDDEVAKMAGLPGIILHGMCTMAFVHNACVRKLGGDPARLGRLSVRFARPVIPGEVLTIEARGAGPWQLRMQNGGGAVVLKNGVAEFAEGKSAP